jgi:hypothetical protein
MPMRLNARHMFLLCLSLATMAHNAASLGLLRPLALAPQRFAFEPRSRSELACIMVAKAKPVHGKMKGSGRTEC